MTTVTYSPKIRYVSSPTMNPCYGCDKIPNWNPMESDTFPKSDAYLKSNRVGFEIYAAQCAGRFLLAP